MCENQCSIVKCLCASPEPFLLVVMNMHHLISDDRVPPMISHEFIVMKLLVADSIVMPIVEFVTRLSEPFRISCWCHQISVNRLCVALVILPSLSMLSHTRTNT